MNVSKRLETPGDEPFLRELVIATVSEELGASMWPEPMRSHLLGIQYTGRRQSMTANYEGTVSEIVLLDGVPAGWICVCETSEEICLVEIMIAGEHRGKGVGSAAIREVFAAAGGAGKPVRLSVSTGNPRAQKLYERLGFRRTGGDDAQVFMERAPQP